MKKGSIASLIVSLLVMPVLASAIDFGQPSGSITTVQNLVTRILTPVWEVFIGISIMMIIFAGILFLFASGDPEKVKTARNAFLWGAVGIAVGVLAFSITVIIKVAVQ